MEISRFFKVQIFVITAIFGVWLSEASAQNAIPDPIVRFSFEGNDPRIQIESGKQELLNGGFKGKTLKVGEPGQAIAWDFSKSPMTWEKGTVSFWFKPLDWKDTKKYHYWLYISAPAPRKHPTPNFVVLNFVDGYTCFQLDDLGSGPGIHCWSGNNLWENDTWYFVTCTWDRQTQAIYINGEIDAGTGRQDITTVLNVTKEVFANGKLYIGTDLNWQKHSPVETSLMDELEIWDTFLNAEQVRQLYFEQKPASVKSQPPVIKSISDSGFDFPKQSRLTVPLSASVPRVDGHVSENEWTDAVRFVGLIDIDTGFLTNDDFTGFLKSDGRNLYAAFKRKVRSIELLNINYSKRDSDVCYDDSWELYLYPKDEGGGVFYQVIANSIGTIFDQYKGDPKWNGNWHIEQYLERPDIWEMELSIPLSELGVKETKEGELFLFGFFFNQKTPETHSLGWTTQTGLFANLARAAVLEFSRSKPVIGVKSLGKPDNGIVAPVIVGTGNIPETTVSLKLPKGHEISKTIGSGQLGQPVQFQPLQGKGTALLSIICPSGSSPDKADFYYNTVIRYDSIPLTVKSTNYPSRKEVCWEINYMAMDRPDAVKKYKVEIGESSKVCDRKSRLPWETFYISTDNLKAGQYKAKIRLLDSNDNTLIAQTADYIKEGNEPWLHNTVGIQKGYVPPPYTPMEIKGRKVNIIGRSIELSETGLPYKIDSNGAALLKEPVKLRGTFGGKQFYLDADRAFEFSSIAADDSNGAANVHLGPFKGTVKQTISFDGFCWYEIELSADANVTAQDVRLEIRLPKDVAKSYILTDTDYKVAKLGEWDCFAGLLSKDLSLGLTPQIWIGNTEAGLAWLMESHKGWQVANEGKVIEIIHEKDCVVLRTNIVDNPIEIKGILKFSFGLQPSPVHPISQLQQRLMIGASRYPELPKETKVCWVYMGQDSTKPDTFVSFAGLPEPAHPEGARREAEKMKDQAFLAPYSEFTWLSMGLSEMSIYKGDWYMDQTWGGTAGSAADPEPFGLVDTENRDYQDFIVWRFMKNWDAYGGNAIYYDLMSPFQKKSEQSKYTTRTGAMAYPWPIRSVREIARRLFIGYRLHNPEMSIFGHASNMYLPVTAFIDAWPKGEDFVFVTNHYPEVLTYDLYRSWMYGYPLGLRLMFLPSMKSPQQIRMDMTDYLVGIVFNHNTTFWLSFCDQTAVHPYLRTYHGGNWPMQKFLPYWQYPKLTSLDPEKFKVSGWYNEKENTGMLCIASLSAEPVTVPIALGRDWKFTKTGILTDACKETLKGWNQAYPSGKTSTVGDYDFYRNADKLGAIYDEKGTAAFKAYGVLMLHVK